MWKVVETERLARRKCTLVTFMNTATEYKYSVLVPDEWTVVDAVESMLPLLANSMNQTPEAE